YDQLRRPAAAAVTPTPVTQNSAHPPQVKAALLRGLIKSDKPSHRERHKKFKADSINQFAGKEIVSFF
ncbi:hypothetical protein, partial [Pseudomonas aeruginosa]|uniref:hypothetical protein n=1 Tax=Pseudomonas aeruginosa TaxID=287 RepID=UPI001F1B0208